MLFIDVAHLLAPSEVTGLVVRAVGARTIMVTWEPPARSMGILRGYFLKFTDIRNGTRDETFVPALRTSRVYLYEQAHVNATYEVQVWAETGGGEGAKRQVVVTTWPTIGE